MFSIIVLNWNGAKWLAPCLKSIQAQTFSSYEVLLADNGSTDESIETAVVIHRPIMLATFSRNLGYTGANNLASKMARGTWLIFLNNDTKLAPDFLEQLVDALVRRPGAHILVPTISDYDGETKGEYHFTLDILGYPTQALTGDPFWGHGCSLTVRHDIFTSLGGFDNDYFIFFEETDFCWRAQITGHDIVGVPSAVVRHFGGGTVGDGSVVNGRSVTSANRRYLSERNRLSNLLKNYGNTTLMVSLIIYLLMTGCAIVALASVRQWALVRAYLKAFVWHIRNWRNTWRKRQFVQSLRVRDDLFVLRRMHHGLRELELLVAFGLPTSRSSG